MSTGRQRQFQKEEALARAIEVFWQKGYSGTSLSDLTEAMGINKPSLYAAFGNKEKLFVSAINEYVEQYGAPHFDKLLNGDASLRERVKAYLDSIANMVTNAKLPGGCFVAASTCEEGSDCLPEGAEETIRSINAASVKAFVGFFRDEQAKGHIESSVSPEVLSDYLLTQQFGLALMARNGISRARLEKMIDHAVMHF